MSDFAQCVALELKHTFWTKLILATRKSYFEAIRSQKVEIDISCEILLNVSLSTWNGRLGLTMICTTRNCYLEAIRGHNVEIEISCEILLNLSLSRKTARFGITIICDNRKR